MEQYSGNRGRTALTVASVVGVATVAALVMQRRRSAPASRIARSGIYVHEAITVNRPLADVYRYWRSFENFPTFMAHLESVETSGRRSIWRAKGPAGLRTEWEAETTVERENDAIAWRTLPGSAVQHSGSVRFEHAPGGRGTEVHVELEYRARGAALGTTLARLFADDPEQQIRDDLRRFKQLLEAGEIPVSDGPGLWRPAQPPERPEELKKLMGVGR